MQHNHTFSFRVTSHLPKFYLSNYFTLQLTFNGLIVLYFITHSANRYYCCYLASVICSQPCVRTSRDTSQTKG